ncbi:MAG: HAMP domain-containing sensor histidine kinase [Thermoguttaceae bacterium]|nr:HAMP domain-containing sensor histidine kinase [Thermoguttaceae bacterium]
MKYRNILLLFIPLLFAVMIVLIGILLIHQQKDFERVYLNESRAEIEQNVQMILDFILPHAEVQELDLLDEFCETFAQGNRSITFFNERGDAVFTAGNVNLRVCQLDLPEIREARTEKKIGIAVRKDPGKEIWTVYAAAEAELPDGRFLLYVTSPAQSVSNVLRSASVIIYWVFLVGTILLVILSIHIFQTVYRPLNRLQQSAEQIAAGQIDTPVATPSHGAVRDLAVSVSRMAEQLKLEIRRVQEQEALRRQFLANVSHEIKTPLTAMLSALQLLEEEGWDDPRRLTKCREILTRQTVCLNTLVQDFLQLVRLENPQETLKKSFEPLQLDEIVSDSVELCEDYALQNSTKIQVKELSPVKINGDAKLLERAFQNLILNAVKYSGSPAVDVSLTSDEEKAIVTIRDFGIGIPPEYAERIFDRFFRIRSADRTPKEGSGLGLAIVNQVMRLHGGTVELVSCDGPGACFECRFDLTV